jgi:hypothetical protein
MRKKKQPREDAHTRKRRSLDDRIAALQAQIAEIKEREARKQAKANPALRHVSAALRSVDKALATVAQERTKDALLEARAWLAAALNPVDAAPGNGRVATRVDEDSLLTYVRNNPGQRGEQIAAAMAADTRAIRPVMKRLIAGGKVRTEGQKRGMTYAAV